MKLPEPPPSLDLLLKQLMEQGDHARITRLLSAPIGPTDSKGRYLPWEKLKHLKPPEGFTPEDYWFAVKSARQKIARHLPLQDKYQKPFAFCMPDSLQKELHWLDQNASGSITMDQPITNPHTRDTYLVSSLIEESISSSQLEGASTTRNVAKEMLRQGRTPTDHSERMIYNNYRAMEVIREFCDDDLTPSMIKHLHQVITEGTLDNEAKAGRLRGDGDDIQVVDNSTGVTLHTPPKAAELEQRLQALCNFANAPSDDGAFIHPVIKAITLHFMIGYDHPFVDGNGRTARALFYWAMARHGYWLMEFVSISRIIKQAPVKYGMAYLHTETDGNDLTYFLLHQVEVIRKGIAALHEYLNRKVIDLEEAEKLLDNSKARGLLNHRQLMLLRHALKNPGAHYDIQKHKTSHAISYQTARTDLLTMADDLRLLNKRKYGKSWVFVSPSDLRMRLKKPTV